MNEQGVKQGCTPGPPFFDMSEQLFVARLTCDSCRYSMFTHISVFISLTQWICWLHYTRKVLWRTLITDHQIIKIFHNL